MKQFLIILSSLIIGSASVASCRWRTGDAIGGIEKYIGRVSNPTVCLRKCKLYTSGGKRPNGVTVDVATGRKCYCEFDATGRNNAITWKSCIFAPPWKGCNWKHGDGIGGLEKKIGMFSGPQECLNKCKQYRYRGKTPNGATVDSKTGKQCYCEFTMTGRNSNRAWKSCSFAPAFKGCNWKHGDGIGGFEKKIGMVTGPLQCLNRCKQYTYRGKMPNGATVDSKTGKKCYCEFTMTGRNSNRAWKSCSFAPAFKGCNWKHGDGIGGFEKKIGIVTGPLQCLNRCKRYTYRGRTPNGATVDSKTGRKCYCEFTMTGRNSNRAWKSCSFAPAFKGCNWKHGDGIGGFEKKIGMVTGPLQCLNQCKQYTYRGKMPNGATVDSKTGKKCYCEFTMTGRNSNRAWKSCSFAPAFKGCNWKHGDGIGGFEKKIGIVTGPLQCLNRCKRYTYRGKTPNGVTVDSKTGRKCYCEFTMTGRNSNRAWKSCSFAPAFKGCNWKHGDGIGGFEKKIGIVTGPLLCLNRCKRYTYRGKTPNGATVDSKTGKKCYCEFTMTGRNSNRAWKSCSFAPAFKGCNWKHGDGIGGFEKKIGIVTGPLQCLNRCKQYRYRGKTPNGATVDSKTGRKCYCEFTMTGRNSNRAWKSCSFAPAFKGCNWKHGDGIGGFEKKIGMVTGPLQCLNRCKQYMYRGKTPNGATVDSKTGKKCYCEFTMTGRNSNRAWKSCSFAPAFKGCNWKHGDGIGGFEKKIGTVTRLLQCLNRCKRYTYRGKKSNGATVDSRTGKNCYCEFTMTGRNSNHHWKSCLFRPAWVGCSWKVGDGTGGSEKMIGIFSGPKQCVTKCRRYRYRGRKPNGATVDANTGKKCYCEFNMRRSNGNHSWKTCRI